MKLRIGIIGIGKIGEIHLRTLSKIKGIKKVYIVDTNQEILKNYSLPSFSDYTALKNIVDAVIIATPTATHYHIAKYFLNLGIPTFVEKPLTNDLKQAKYLLQTAIKKKTILFVGHVERYNSAYLKTRTIIKNPRFIECHRLSPYPFRSLDISVVLDLMIHDLDIILDIVKDTIKTIESVGIKVLSPHIDIANTRITFQKGCIANITASRVSSEKVRKFRVFFPNHYISLDYARQKIEIYKKHKRKISRKTLTLLNNEPIKKEIEDFLHQIKNKNHSLSSAQKAVNALSIAFKIEKQIYKNL